MSPGWKRGWAISWPFLGSTKSLTSSSAAILIDKQKLLVLDKIKRVLKPNGNVCLIGVILENESTSAAFQPT
jgi:ubiquinone/menaquinone biosynthesis C-methylase UbiE